jgi:hypothetical protein
MVGFSKLAGTALVAMLAIGQLAEAGRWAAPGVDVKTVPALGTVQYTESFVGGRLATVEVDGDGRTILALEVYDANGILVARDVGFSPAVIWKPLWNVTFTILVINRGRVNNQYQMQTN